MAVAYKWPHGVKTAIALTFDNMGEAADLNRGLWPDSKPLGSHYSVTDALPKMLAILKKYDIYMTYFIETWNFNQYPTVVANQVAAAGHEVAWHAWQHEAWNNLKDGDAEREIFERSFGEQGLAGFITGAGKGRSKVLPYRGFRPPGGIVNGERTLSLCREYGMGYVSPAAEKAALVKLRRDDRMDTIAILPFRWQTVDAFYYMESFAGLRKIKGDRERPLGEDVLMQRYIAEIDKAIKEGQFLSLLFHPFLTDSAPRLEAMEAVVRYLARKREEGLIWVARMRDIDQHVRQYPRCVGEDPEWDLSRWT